MRPYHAISILGNSPYVDARVALVGVNVEPIRAVNDVEGQRRLEAGDRVDSAGEEWLEERQPGLFLDDTRRGRWFAYCIPLSRESSR